MEIENLEALIDFAIEKEQEAAEFYRGLRKNAGFKGAEAMFKEFEVEENKHEKMLEEFKAKGITQKMEEYEFKWITDIKRSDYSIDIDYRKDMAYDEILMIAMKREEKSLMLYNAFLKNAKTSEIQTLFKILCQEEAKHKLALETMYDEYMAKMGD